MREEPQGSCCPYRERLDRMFETIFAIGVVVVVVLLLLCRVTRRFLVDLVSDIESFRCPRFVLVLSHDLHETH